MSSPKFNTLEDYLIAQDSAKEKTLRDIIAFIVAEFPSLEAKIAWNVPVIHQGGHYVFGLAAYRRHLTLAPWSPRVLEDFRVKLDAYVLKKNCFHVPMDWVIDKELLKDLVRARLTELGRQ